MGSERLAQTELGGLVEEGILVVTAPRGRFEHVKDPIQSEIGSLAGDLLSEVG